MTKIKRFTSHPFAHDEAKEEHVCKQFDIWKAQTTVLDILSVQLTRSPYELYLDVVYTTS